MTYKLQVMLTLTNASILSLMKVEMTQKNKNQGIKIWWANIKS